MLARKLAAREPNNLANKSIRNMSRVVSLLGRDFLSLKDYKKDEIYRLLWTALDLKHRTYNEHQLYQPLRGSTVAMLFQKRSTRTRLSTEAGVTLLGGHASFLSASDIHLGVNESIEDSAKVLSSYSDAILARVHDHSVLTDLCSGSVPVINGLSDTYHPLQILADFMTLQEHFGRLKPLKLAYIGDGNNMAHSYMTACTQLDIDLRVATPKGYEPNEGVVQNSQQLARDNKETIMFTHDPMEAAENADAIITDTWVSMGQESEKSARLNDFSGYQIDRKVMAMASRDSVFLHCLPRKADEVTDDVFYSPRSLVWPEARNRMWTVMSVILHLLKEHTPQIAKPDFDKNL